LSQIPVEPGIQQSADGLIPLYESEDPPRWADFWFIPGIIRHIASITSGLAHFILIVARGRSQIEE